MSCPTCSADMPILVPGPMLSYYLCERCGTVCAFNKSGERRHTFIPKLVERCRRFKKEMDDAFAVQGMFNVSLWDSLGIEESIHLPEERKVP